MSLSLEQKAALAAIRETTAAVYTTRPANRSNALHSQRRALDASTGVGYFPSGAISNALTEGYLQGNGSGTVPTRKR